MGREDLRAAAVLVENLGDEPATQVQVVAELTTAEATYSADQTLEVLSGEGERSLVFVFAEDPASGDLRVEVRRSELLDRRAPAMLPRCVDVSWSR